MDEHRGSEAGRARAIAIGGIDPTGRAGLAADVRAFGALGVHAGVVVTCTTAQRAGKVERLDPVAPDVLHAQLRAAAADLFGDGHDAASPRWAKVGALGAPGAADVIGAHAAERGLSLVVDPVLSATGGGGLGAGPDLYALGGALLGATAVFTPNLPEAEAWLAAPIDPALSSMRAAAETLADRADTAVWLKGGHAGGDEVVDVVVLATGTRVLRAPRRSNAHTRGSGCTLASLLCGHLALGFELDAAVDRTWDRVQAAIAHSRPLAGQPGPLDVLGPEAA